MTQLRHLVADPDAVWALKDQIRDERLLDRDPVHLNRTMFERWLKVRAKVELADALEGDVDDVQETVVERLAPFVQAWRREAARRNSR